MCSIVVQVVYPYESEQFGGYVWGTKVGGDCLLQHTPLSKTTHALMSCMSAQPACGRP